jgi:hypothetical protein
MPGARTISQLRGLSDEQLIEEHDRTATNTVVGISYYLDEIQRREVDRQQRQMLRLTWVVTVLTVVNVVAVIVSLL